MCERRSLFAETISVSWGLGLELIGILGVVRHLIDLYEISARLRAGSFLSLVGN